VSLALASVVGAMCFAGLGLLTACRAQTVEAASGLMNLIQMPMWLLSGVFFSTANFPAAMQPFIEALPLTALNEVLRGVMIDGASLAALAAPLGITAAWGAVSFAVALRLFRWL
jgi:ABC-type multidrug transport system permease subunit